MKRNKDLIYAIVTGLTCVVILVLFDVEQELHFLVTQLLLAQVVMGILFYRKYVWVTTLLLVTLHVILDGVVGGAFPLAAAGESVIQLMVLQVLFVVTKRHEAADARLRQLIEATRVGTWEWNLITGKVVINDRWAEMLGYTKDELEPVTFATFENLVHPEDLVVADAQLKEVIAGKRDFYDVEVRMRHKDGHYHWMNDQGNITKRDRHGKPLFFCGSHSDISVRRRQKEEIQHQHDLMNHIIDHMNSGIAVHDKDLNYIYVSKHYRDQYNIEEDIIGKHHYEVFPDLPQKWRDVHQRSLKGEVVSADRDEYVHEDGTVETTRWECRPWYDNNGDIGGIIVYTEVINDFIEIEQELKQSKDLLEHIIASVPVGIAVMTTPPDPTFHYINDRFYEIFGLDSHKIERWDFWDQVFDDPAMREENKARFFTDLANDGGEHVIWTDVPIYQGGTIKQYITAMATPLREHDLLITTVMDTTRRKELELSLERQAYSYFIQKEQSDATLMAIGDAVISTDARGIVTAFNDIACDLTGFQKDDAIGRPFCEIFRIVDEGTGEPLSCPVAEVIRDGKTIHLQNHTMLITKDGDHRIIEDSAAPIRNQDGDLTGVILVFRDVTERKRKQDEIRYLSLHDHLTGLHNRRYFSEELARLDDPKHYPLGVMMIDLNGLKIINDAYGHDIGDEALVKSARVMEEVIADRGVLARVGGDEFTVALSKTSTEELQALKEAILDGIAQESIQNMKLSLSIGYELKTEADQSLADLYKDAENIMYKYKLASGGSVRNHAIQAIYKTLTDKYELERNHSHRVSELSVALGSALGMHADELKELELSGLFHDIGKISIPDSILNKPSRLTKEEYGIIQSHTRNGYAILRAADEYSDLAKNALYHHEHYDGGGYPEGLKGEEIPIQARIIHIADAYEAMTSDRPYRKALTEQVAIAELKKYRGTQFDPDLIDLFLQNVLSQNEPTG